MYDDVLIPTDGSEAAEPAIERGIDLCVNYGATAHALYVVQPLYTVEGEFGRVYDTMQEFGEDALAVVEERAAEAGVEVVTAVRNGPPHEEILEYAEETGIDLIVMGTHGRTGLARWLIGSVTERVVRLSPVPVLTVRADLPATE